MLFNNLKIDFVRVKQKWNFVILICFSCFDILNSIGIYVNVSLAKKASKFLPLQSEPEYVVSQQPQQRPWHSSQHERHPEELLPYQQMHHLLSCIHVSQHYALFYIQVYTINTPLRWAYNQIQLSLKYIMGNKKIQKHVTLLDTLPEYT